MNCVGLARDFRLDGFSAADRDWRVMPPVALGQREGRRNVGFATWAYVNDHVAARLERVVKRLAPGEWKCGGKPVFIDLIAPFVGREEAMKELEGVLG